MKKIQQVPLYYGDRGDGQMVMCLPFDPEKRKELAAALRYQLEHDTNEKDKEIHKMALKQLEQDVKLPF